ncbi:MAG: response regulator transcription factor [Patiriisocius sp.]|uniref:response regulator transcription factor n=1 Tax=Patiriisocius sp. TaxID=2822396 RepID=UPI003EFA3B32
MNPNTYKMNLPAQNLKDTDHDPQGNSLNNVQQQISKHILNLISENQPLSNYNQLKTQDESHDNVRYLHNSNSIVKEIKQITKVLSKIYIEVNEQGLKAKKLNSLTKQELNIFHLISKGLQTKEIAATLFISVHTVNAHRKNIYKKLEINNVASLVKLSLIIDMVQ